MSDTMTPIDNTKLSGINISIDGNDRVLRVDERFPTTIPHDILWTSNSISLIQLTEMNITNEIHFLILEIIDENPIIRGMIIRTIEPRNIRQFILDLNNQELSPQRLLEMVRAFCRNHFKIQSV